MIVVEPDSASTALAELAGKKVSASVGSAADGTLVRALQAPASTRTRASRSSTSTGGGCLGAGTAGARALAVRGVAGAAGLPGQGEGAVRRSGAERTRRSTASRPPRVREEAPRGARRLPAGAGRGHRVHQPQPVDAAESWPRPPACPRRSCTSTTAPAARAFDPTVKPSLVDALKGTCRT